ncbi:family 16 glycoside hydrolase [Planctomicrobium sp. SH664]|uniref:family 16 glycoside hydrolase n=1 Tax=Planctomicrobium sp. SH664 TaxID=3448125 RepID=UPI003F5C57A5
MIRTFVCLLGTCLIAATAVAADPAEQGFVSIFDGKSLAGWRGDAAIWRVEDGTIVGETTPEKTIPQNTFLVWDQGEVDDFVLKLKFRISGEKAANSGVQIRSKQREDGRMIGYQADFDLAGKWVGGIYEELGRGVLVRPGTKLVATTEKKPKGEELVSREELDKLYHQGEWNDLVIRAEGHHLTVQVNGVTTADLTDRNPEAAVFKGLVGLQVHAGPPMKVEFKDIALKRLPLQFGFKKVVLVAGSRSHSYFTHEHRAGCLLLQEGIDNSRKEQGLKVVTSLYTDGWPKDPTAFDNADAIVFYCDGGAKHPVAAHLDEIDRLVNEKQVGVVCIHYGVEIPKGPGGDHFLKWIGGYFETNYSVNPHWTASFSVLPVHPVTRGVNPFEMNDEWYYHMRFVPQMTGVMPILSDIPPRETLNRPEGPHSSNPHVREAVLVREEPQHVAWAYERPDSKGRGFGFTGGHFHQNWQNDDFRKLVLNAIVWTAGADVPATGVESPTPDEARLEENQDEAKPKNYKHPEPVKYPPLKATSHLERIPTGAWPEGVHVSTEVPEKKRMSLSLMAGNR